MFAQCYIEALNGQHRRKAPPNNYLTNKKKPQRRACVAMAIYETCIVHLPTSFGGKLFAQEESSEPCGPAK